jgi:hypothetical protein
VAFDAWALGKGYRPVCVSGYNAGEVNRYAAIWEKRKGPAWELEYGLTRAQLREVGKRLGGKGYRPVCLSGYNHLRVERYAAVWEKGDRPAWALRFALSRADLARAAAALKDKGYEPSSLSSYNADGVAAYAGIWEKRDRPAWEMSWDLTAAQLRDKADDLQGRGYFPLSVAGRNAGGLPRYSALWARRKGTWQMRSGLTEDELVDLARRLNRAGYRPVFVSGFNTPRGDRYCSIWVK